MIYTPTYRFALFDMDGTLLDSMHSLRGGCIRHLLEYGQNDLAERYRTELLQTVTPKTRVRVNEWAAERGFPEFTVERHLALCAFDYEKVVHPKDRVPEFLAGMKRAGVRMAVLTATKASLSLPPLERLGLLPYFEFVQTCEGFPKGKSDPEVFFAALARFGARPEETAMFEDSDYSLRVAKSIGMHTVAIPEYCMEPVWPEMCALADEILPTYPVNIAPPVCK